MTLCASTQLEPQTLSDMIFKIKFLSNNCKQYSEQSTFQRVGCNMPGRKNNQLCSYNQYLAKVLNSDKQVNNHLNLHNAEKARLSNTSHQGSNNRQYTTDLYNRNLESPFGSIHYHHRSFLDLLLYRDLGTHHRVCSCRRRLHIYRSGLRICLIGRLRPDRALPNARYCHRRSSVEILPEDKLSMRRRPAGRNCIGFRTAAVHNTLTYLA